MKRRIRIIIGSIILVIIVVLVWQHYKAERRQAEWEVLMARGIGECIVSTMFVYAEEHDNHLPPFNGWRKSIKPYLMRPPMDDLTRMRVIDGLPYYDYSKEIAGKDCSKMLSDETIVLTRTRGLPRGTKIEVYLDGLGRITRPPPPFWKRWFRRTACPYQ